MEKEKHDVCQSRTEALITTGSFLRVPRHKLYDAREGTLAIIGTPDACDF